jgi:hypothetical protein
VFILAMSTACSGLLDVSDPTLVRDSDVANASGANARRLNVTAVLNTNAPQLAENVARITDEWIRDLRAGNDYLDRRDSQGYEQFMQKTDQHVGLWDQVYWQTSLAIPSVRAYTPDSLRGDFLGQLYAIRGYAVLQLAEDVCSGFPLNDVTPDNRPIFSAPLTTDSATAIASAQLDSAVKYVHDSVRFVVLARVAKGRALLDAGKYAEAAAMVAPVATTDTYQTDGPLNVMGRDMSPGTWNRGGVNYAVGDNEGGNGLPFVSAHDPRVPTVLGGTRATIPTDTLYKAANITRTAPMVLASGIEARLIEAEAALQAGQLATWLTTLNALRTDGTFTTAPNPNDASLTDTTWNPGTGGYAGLAPLADPGTTAAQIDLLYRERAFWLYGTGRRLGDLRRLIKNYGRDPETVFPTGSFLLGGSYQGATAIPFILAGQQISNPHITSGCTTR